MGGSGKVLWVRAADLNQPTHRLYLAVSSKTLVLMWLMHCPVLSINELKKVIQRKRQVLQKQISLFTYCDQSLGCRCLYQIPQSN